LRALVHSLASVRRWVAALPAALRCGREARLASVSRERRLSVAFRCGRKGGPCAGWSLGCFGRTEDNGTRLRSCGGGRLLRQEVGFRGAVGCSASARQAAKPRREQEKGQWVGGEVSGGPAGGGSATSVERSKQAEVHERPAKGRTGALESSDEGANGWHSGSSTLRWAVEAGRPKRRKQHTSVSGGRRGGSRGGAHFGGRSRGSVNLERTLEGNKAQGRTGCT